MSKNELVFDEFVSEIEFIKNIELYKARIKNKIWKYNKHWRENVEESDVDVSSIV